MIVEMRKVYVVSRAGDKDRLLGALRDLGAVHLAPVEPARAVAEEETVAAMDRLGRALQVVAALRPAGEPLQMPPAEAAAEVLRIHRAAAERRSRLATLHRQAEHLAVWGDVRLEQLAALREAGIEPRFFSVPDKAVAEIQAELVHVIAALPGKRSLVAVIHRDGEPAVPEEAEAVALPQKDRPSILAEAAEIDAELKEDGEKLGRLAHLAPRLEAELASLRRRAEYTIATRGALAGEGLFAIQGWMPAERAPTLGADLAAGGVETVVQMQEPAPEDAPPTLIRPAWWARPIEGLFKILGTVPGYGEFDVSAAFMIALPIFAAILISDAGYGLLYLLLGAAFYRKIAAKMGPQLSQLIIAIGVLSVVWGVMTCSFFGFDISGHLAAIAWPSASIGGLFAEGPPIAVDMETVHLNFLMRISFALGAIQLSAAHLWRARANIRSLRFLGNVGWAIWLWGMYGLVQMFVLKDPFSGTVYPWFLLVGGALAILFAEPSRNVLKALGLGLANFPLSAIGTFGDTVSYLRLMAIGLAGTSLAIAFNDIAHSLPWFGQIPILMAGHGLNVALSVVSLFAHGVRLNMLEFSNNLGMQWNGYAYEPFSNRGSQEN